MVSNKQLLVERLLKQKVSLSHFSHEMSKSGVYVVGPTEIVSSIYFRDERRFFPRVNEDDIVIGGYFG